MSNTYERIRGEVLAGGALGEEDQTAGGPRAILGLGAIALLLVALAIANIWTFVFVVGLLISIFLHECGHYVTARRSGMKVTQFFMGMGPKVWSFRRGEIEYGVRALPIGAFVRIIGMNNLDETPPEDEDRAYRNKSYPRRMLTITAGSIMHMIIAIVLLFTVYATWGKNQPSGRIGFVEVVKGQAADVAGLQPGDFLVSIDGKVPTTSDDLGVIVRGHAPGESISLVVSRHGKDIQLDPVLGTSTEPTTKGAAYLGVRSGEENHFVGQSLGTAFVDSFTDLGSAAWQSVGGVVKVMNPVNIYQHLVGQNNDQATQPVTVYGISRLSSDIGNETGLAGILLTLAGVNVFVGLLNMVPLLPFDGGHAAVATYERIRSRKGKVYRADVGKMVPVAMAVMTFLVFVLFTGLYLDITKPIG
ncbi:MAG: peptidase family protein [Ilumatobacteraceae bacterium]|nr:peptidase family protein [Ilumatobacteraceae bacterium]